MSGTSIVSSFNPASRYAPVWLASTLAIIWLLGSYFGGLIGISLFLIFIIVIAVVSVHRIRWGIALLIYFSAAHFVIKELSPSILADVWREVILAFLLFSWLLRVSWGRLPWFRKDAAPVGTLLLGYLGWGLLVVLLSSDLLVGIAGFRFVMGFAPLFFIASSTVRDEADIRLYVRVFLASGVLVASIAIIQFLLVSILGLVDHGTGIDFARKYAPFSVRSAGIPWDRSVSILIGPNELGIFMAICLALCFGYYLSNRGRSESVRLLLACMIILGLGLLVSMSRTAIIGTVAAYLVVGLISRNRFRWLWVGVPAVGVALLIAPFYFAPLFRPVIGLADPYFTGTLARLPLIEYLDYPFIWGRGYGATLSSLETLGRGSSSLLLLGSVDFYFAEAIEQVGWVGLLLFMIVWILFVWSAYKAWRRAQSTFARGTAIGLLGVFIVVMVGSAHIAAWEYVSFAASYYVLGAISTRLLAIESQRRTGVHS